MGTVVVSLDPNNVAIYSDQPIDCYVVRHRDIRTDCGVVAVEPLAAMPVEDRVVVSEKLDAQEPWKQDMVQFPRLLAELEAAGAIRHKGVLKALTKSMDLTAREIGQIVGRAQNAWDDIKGVVLPMQQAADDIATEEALRTGHFPAD